ncbi:MAG: hypothetical protein V4808_15115 [Pseudomonadota bacterium]
MIALALALVIQSEKLPQYADAVKCAGLTAAQHKLLGHYNAKSEAAFDASIFWSMAAMERARKDGADHARFERDVADAAELATAGLVARSRTVRAELKKCIARVPN